MCRVLYKIVDTVILILCLPFYAVAVPVLALYEVIVPRVRRVRVGLEVCHWPAPDVREDLLVVDVSWLNKGLVGVRRRVWNVLYARGAAPPPYPEAVEYCTVSDFWLGPARLLKRRSSRLVRRADAVTAVGQ